MLTTLKVRLSTLRHRSWHYRLVKFAYGKSVKNFRGTRKACPYWWLIVPSSALVAGVKLIAILIAVIFYYVFMIVGSIVYWVMVALGWFFGRRPYYWTFWHYTDYAWFHEDDQYPKKYPMFRPYKRKVRNTAAGSVHGSIRIAPWQVVLPIVAVGGLVIGLIFAARPSAHWSGHHYMLFVWIAGFIAALYVLGIVYRKLVVPGLKRLYAKYCPEITWVDDDEKAETE